jgi:poly-beta-hydroxyalkanoate depolymerase
MCQYCIRDAFAQAQYMGLLLCLLGVASGHFDILIGKKVDTEVFPLIHQFLEQHDMPLSRL